MNPNARIPVVELVKDKYLWESNAILNYFAEGTEFLPQEREAEYYGKQIS